MTHPLKALGLLALAALTGGAARAAAQATDRLEVKYVRDSETYATLTRQVYRQALASVRRQVADPGRQGPWAVVLDIDETALDNSAYQLELAAYGTGYTPETWNAWAARREAGLVPGVYDFVAGARELSGRVAWISGRFGVSREDTRANLERVGLWQEGDLLCLKDDPEYSKAQRRNELTSGQGKCSWEGTAVTVFAFVGDQMGDFPAAGEPFPHAGDDGAFGTVFFILPDPMYGPWTRRVTRKR